MQWWWQGTTVRSWGESSPSQTPTLNYSPPPGGQGRPFLGSFQLPDVSSAFSSTKLSLQPSIHALTLSAQSSEVWTVHLDAYPEVPVS